MPALSGYRDGDHWFNAAGEPLTDPSVSVGWREVAPRPSTVPTPTQRAQESESEYGLVPKALPAESFGGCTPQTVVMPRIAFAAFPITDEALFNLPTMTSWLKDLPRVSPG
ncbi:MAG: hypothetical protein U5L96_15410 [Owenweeksia sp.]|nr:hypothetical protein [Owenweeksia sp.]